MRLKCKPSLKLRSIQQFDSIQKPQPGLVVVDLILACFCCKKIHFSVYCAASVTKVLPFKGAVMKTITIKASDDFAQNLLELAEQMRVSKSEVIRQAVEKFRQQQEQSSLKFKMQAAAKKVQLQTFAELEDWDATLEDGLCVSVA